MWALLCTFWATFVVVLCDLVFWENPHVSHGCECLSMWDQTPHLVPGGLEIQYPDVAASFTCARQRAIQHAAALTPSVRRRLTRRRGPPAADPYNYGLVTCLPHDYSLAPYCNGTVLSVEGWCADSWCYVSEACTSEKTASNFFPGLWYSYAACEEPGTTSSSRHR